MQRQMANFKFRGQSKAFQRNNRTMAEINNWATSVKKDNVVVFILAVWLISFTISLLFIFLNLNSLPGVVPLFFSRPWGEERLASKEFLWILPLGSLFLAVFNAGFGLSFHPRNIFLSRILFGIMALVSILITISVVNIVYLLR